MLGHDSSVFFIDPTKKDFVEVDESREIGELRAFSWSFDGQSLAVAGVTRGSGNLYLANPVDESLQALVEDPNLGYLSGIAWSWDGAQLLTWESRKPSEFYVVDRETGEVAVYELPGYFIRTLAFAPDGNVVFDGANQTTAELFRVGLDDLQPELISGLVESAGSYAWSPDGTRLAFFKADRSEGEARLVVEDESGKGVIATLPIPTGSGSSIPGTEKLTWTSDGKALVFEFGQCKTRRAVYLAPVDGSGLVKLAEPAYAPAVSPDGRCLAYISEKQVFMMDLAALLENQGEISEPILLGEVPSGRGRSNVDLDRLEWQSAGQD